MHAIYLKYILGMTAILEIECITYQYEQEFIIYIERESV